MSRVEIDVQVTRVRIELTLPEAQALLSMLDGPEQLAELASLLDHLNEAITRGVDLEQGKRDVSKPTDPVKHGRDSGRAPYASPTNQDIGNAVAYVGNAVAYVGNAVDVLANLIRTVDGNHDLGAGALAEALVQRGVRPMPLATPATGQAMNWPVGPESLADHLATAHHHDMTGLDLESDQEVYEHWEQRHREKLHRYQRAVSHTHDGPV